MSEIETGCRWWIRYVIVPLIGGGGIIALAIAFFSQPDAPERTQAPMPAQNPESSMGVGQEAPPSSTLTRQSSAEIDILGVPPQGGGSNSKGIISGRVRGLDDPSKYRIVIYARTDRWYVQPSKDQSLTFIDDSGNWQNTTHLGSEYAALLVASSFDPPESPDAIPGGNEVITVFRKAAAGNP